MADRLEQAVGEYLRHLGEARSLGAGVAERSFYPALAELLNTVGADLKPRVLCLSELADTGVGHPDFGLFTGNQCQRGEPRAGQRPERGVVEVKGLADETWLTADTKQVSDYWGAYRLVLVTNYRDFALIGEDEAGRPARLEGFRLADSAAAFWLLAATPQKSARQIGKAFGEYLRRALTHSVALREPRDVAWFLASYARDALQRVERAGDLPALATLRTALEDALGVSFEGEKGDHFFRSTLVQTLFYGVFSAWVLWARERTPGDPKRFDWRTAVWHLRVPIIQTLFQQIASPTQLRPLDLIEVLDWTANTLNRIEPAEFFARFKDAEAVQFFYEPFLEAFDPELRKQLGVWYTPVEVVAYMVARADKALREDLGVADGLAADNVYVLDPCCGTGAYLAAVLRRIDAALADRGLGALKGQMIKKAATGRVFGFEIMPAPFVVAHLQVGLLLRSLDAPLAEDGTERAGVYLTNALTGWEPTDKEKQHVAFASLEQERDLANEVKRDKPILVILGNPPYNSYAGMAVGEERDLSNAYRTVKDPTLRPPEGQGLNDLYIRFFRMAERRIAEKTGRGIVCFISNYSWLDGLSFTGMRERYLEAFDAIRIDCLNGDKYKTGKTTPDGKPDPSIFSTEHNREGIQVGTAIATLVRKADHTPTRRIGVRNLWGAAKRQDLLDTAERATADLYESVTAVKELGLPFLASTVTEGYFDWPRLPDLMPTSFPGVKTSRDEFLVAIDRDVLEERLKDYFDPSISDAVLKTRRPAVMKKTGRYDPEETRKTLLKRGMLHDNILRYAYRPFDVRWLYWEPEENLLDRRRDEYRPHVFAGNMWLSAGERNRKDNFYQPQLAMALADHHLVESNVGMFPIFLKEHQDHNGELRPNVSHSVARLLNQWRLSVEHAFQHVIAILHSENYQSDNGGALRMDWPRVPIPRDPAILQRSGQLGETLAALLNPENPVAGVTTGALRSELRLLAAPSRQGGGSLSGNDFALTAGWGSTQSRGIVMPGRGKSMERPYRAEELDAFDAARETLGLSRDEILALLGETTFDVYLNDDAYWANVPAKVWAYTLGGYQAIKKWLSYREKGVLGRDLRPEEVAYVAETVRRIAAILLLGPALDANYAAAKADAVPWRDGRPAPDAAMQQPEADA